MKIRSAPTARRGRADLACFLAFEGRSPRVPKALASAVEAFRSTGDLDRGHGSVSLYHPAGRGGPRRLLAAGMGRPADLDPERLRRAAARIQHRAEALGVSSYEVHLDAADLKGIDLEAAGRAFAEGAVLGAYRYRKPSGKKPGPRKGQRADVFLHGAGRQRFQAGVRTGVLGGEATCFARDLENRPGNLLTPTRLAAEARKLAGEGVRVKVLDERQMARLRMGALLGVSRGSKQPARLILLEHGPARASETVCVVGKGLTFDSGGISIKPAAKMDEMRYDMCGAGSVLGLFHAIRHGGLRGGRRSRRVVGIVAAVENMPDGDAQRPGDVVTAMNGKTIEVLNTDAEGRLVLADALSYAVKHYRPDRIVDLATLTGAVVVALGHELAGIMGNDDGLIGELIEAGAACHEPLWQLPLWEVHRKQVESRYADLANLNSPGQGGGSIAGGALLANFVGDVPWAHIDIAGAAWGAQAKDYYRSGATGTAVRTLLHWLRT